MNKLMTVMVPLLAAETVFGGWGQSPDGTFWNNHTQRNGKSEEQRFIYAPTLEFKSVEGARAYVFEILDDIHEFHALTNSAAMVDLEKIWQELPVGFVTITARALDQKGAFVGEAGRRVLWKKAAFDPSKYEGPAMDYALARTRVIDCFIRQPHIMTLKATGKIDLANYALNGYPSKMLSSEVTELSAFAKNGTFGEADAAELMDIARKAADFMIGYSVPAGEPLEYFPRTYHEEGSEYGRFKGDQDRIHLLYPAKGGVALANIYVATEEKKYLEASERIARTYIKLQEKDGTWPMQLNAKTAKPYNQNRLVPMDVIFLMEKLYKITGKAEYRKCADEAFRFMDEGPMRNWNWEGQFEDGAKMKVATHQNLSNFPANMMAAYLVERFPGDAKRIAQAEELVKFVEDQFIDWEPPFDHGRNRVEAGKRGDDGSWNWFCRPTSAWCCPVVLEQYACYVPVDASSAKTVNTLLAVYKATKKPRYYQMAKALVDAQTRMIEEDGFLNTWSVKGVKRNDHRHHTWDNCTMEMMTALGNFAAVECP